MLRQADYNPPGINNYVPAMQYDVNAHLGPISEFSLGTLTALDADGIHADLNAQAALTAILYRSSFVPGTGGVGAETEAKFGRCVGITPSGNPGASGYSARIHGEDYIGQPMAETLTIASGGTTIVNGSKAFKRITKIVPLVVASNAVTIDFGWIDRFGLPYKVGQYIGGSEGTIDTIGGGGVIVETASAFTFDNAGTATIVSPIDGYATGVTLEITTASTAGVSVITGTTLGAEYTITVPIMAAGTSIDQMVDPDAWVAVTRGQNLVWTSDGAGTGGVGNLIAYFSEGGTAIMTSPDTTDPATATTKDPRGLYIPYSAPNGAKEYKVKYIPNSAVNASGNGGLHGIAHFNV